MLVIINRLSNYYSQNDMTNNKWNYGTNNTHDPLALCNLSIKMNN